MATPRNPLAAFIWGAGGAALTPEEIARRREVEDALLAKGGVDTSPVGHWTQGLARVANAAAGAYRRNKLDGAQTENDDYNKSLVETLFGRSSSTPASDGAVPMTDAAAEVSGTAPTSGQPIDMTGNEIYDQFMGTVKEGVTNPYALAAVAATAKAESGFDPGNVNRTWSDPSESGQAGTAGGLMSWRGPRYEALAATGDLSPAGQARFFLGEDPALIEKLNGAQSVEEAQSLMNNAWKFAGYNRPGGEAANRLAAAQSFLPTFQGGGEVAAVSPEAAIEAVSPIEGALPVEGASLADEVADYEGSQDYAAQFGGTTGQPLPENEFDKRFGDTPLPAEQLTGRDAVAKALMEQQSQLNPAQAAITDQAAALPTADAAQAAVTGGQPVEMAQAATGQQGLSGIPTEELLRVLTDPRANANTRAVAQALMQQQEAARRQQEEQQTWMQRQQYEEQRQSRDPLRQAQIEKMQREAANPNAEESFFGNPVAIQNQDGSISYGQIGNRGSFKPIQLGEGQSFAPPTKTIDGGTENLVVDQAGNVIARMPKNLAEAESQKVQGKAQGEAAASLPADMQQAEQTIANIDKLIDNKGLDSIVGQFDQYRGKTLLGREGRDALARLEQLQGGAFLQAYGLLKGGGQITEVEGIKAERAMARMDRALDEADFRAALRDFREAVSTGADKLRQKAGLPARDQDAGEKSIREMTDEELEALANGQ